MGRTRRRAGNRRTWPRRFWLPAGRGSPQSLQGDRACWFTSRLPESSFSRSWGRRGPCDRYALLMGGRGVVSHSALAFERSIERGTRCSRDIDFYAPLPSIAATSSGKPSQLQSIQYPYSAASSSSPTSSHTRRVIIQIITDGQDAVPLIRDFLMMDQFHLRQGPAAPASIFCPFASVHSAAWSSFCPFRRCSRRADSAVISSIELPHDTLFSAPRSPWKCILGAFRGFDI